jgi:hypothetical protein
LPKLSLDDRVDVIGVYGWRDMYCNGHASTITDGHHWIMLQLASSQGNFHYYMNIAIPFVATISGYIARLLQSRRVINNVTSTMTTSYCLKTIGPFHNSNGYLRSKRLHMYGLV